MEIFYCKTSNGVRPPQYQHRDLALAVAEAKRLSEVHNCDVEILKVIGSVKWKPVPVTEMKPVLEMLPDYSRQDEELPF